MAELVNLRTVRKQAKRTQNEQRANANRLAHGRPKRLRKLEADLRAKASHELDRHQIATGDGR